MSGERIGKELFLKPAWEVAPLILGAYICRRTPSGVIRLEISETECYFGEEDTACHASRGRTKRTQTLYHEGGEAYVYLCYGIHSLLNVVTGASGHPEGVLIRSAGGYDGPGKLTKALSVTCELNGEDLCVSDRLWVEYGNPHGSLTGSMPDSLQDNMSGSLSGAFPESLHSALTDGPQGGMQGMVSNISGVVCRPRVGIAYASESDRQRLWNFSLPK